MRPRRSKEKVIGAGQLDIFRAGNQPSERGSVLNVDARSPIR